MIDIPPLRSRALAALRAIEGAPRGLRLSAYPSVMPMLVEMGLVEERPVPKAVHPGQRAWFLTPSGREVVRMYGVDEA